MKQNSTSARLVLGLVKSALSEVSIANSFCDDVTITFSKEEQIEFQATIDSLISIIENLSRTQTNSIQKRLPLKNCFQIALASAGLSQADWAKKHNVTEPGLSMLLSGKMKSKRLSKAINDFVETEFKKLRMSKFAETSVI